VIPCNPDGPLAAALAFLRSDAVERCETSAPGTLGPYAFKHKIEEWYEAHGRRIYIAEQDLVVAAILLGIPFARHPYHSGVVMGLRPKNTRRRDAADVIYLRDRRNHV
jgi:hypothetical protein